MHQWILILHILGATIWTGGHLVLVLSVLPEALRSRSPEVIVQFETRFERVALPALLVQVATGLWLSHRYLPNVRLWFSFDNVLSHIIVFKLSLLAATLILAIHARFRLLPALDEQKLNALAWHIVPVTVLSVLFVLAGVAFRTGRLF